MSWGAVIGGAAALVGGKVASDAAGSASKKQGKSAQLAIDEQRAAREQVREDLSPFRDAGAGVLNPLQSFVLDGPETDLERTRGFQDIQRSAAAGGKLQSGGTLEELTQFNNMLNSRNRGQRFSELFNLASLGSNAASGQATATQNFANNIGSLQVGAGNSAAAASVAQGNAINQTVSDLTSLISKKLDS